MAKQKTKEITVGDYSEWTMDQIEAELLALNALGKSNLDIGPVAVLRQASYIIAEQLELIEEVKRRGRLTDKQFEKLIEPKKRFTPWPLP